MTVPRHFVLKDAAQEHVVLNAVVVKHSVTVRICIS
jgi:hypothetical protein